MRNGRNGCTFGCNITINYKAVIMTYTPQPPTEKTPHWMAVPGNIPILTHDGQYITDAAYQIPAELPEPQRKAKSGKNKWIALSETFSVSHAYFLGATEIINAIWLPAPSTESKEENGWISVEDRLPPVMEAVLIYDPRLKIVSISTFSKGYQAMTAANWIEKGRLSHWQLLPSPPKV